MGVAFCCPFSASLPLISYGFFPFSSRIPVRCSVLSFHLPTNNESSHPLPRRISHTHTIHLPIGWRVAIACHSTLYLLFMIMTPTRLRFSKMKYKNTIPKKEPITYDTMRYIPLQIKVEWGKGRGNGRVGTACLTSQTAKRAMTKKEKRSRSETHSYVRE